MSNFLLNLIEKEGEIGGHHANNGSPTEDGNHSIAIHIFDNIGIESKFVLDIGAFSSNASNVMPISEKFQTEYLLLDGDNKYSDPLITKVWLTKDNICSILNKHNCPKKIDYISVDIDNMDYWIVKSLLEGGYSSNLMIVEFNPIFSFEESFVKSYFSDARKNDVNTMSSSNYGVSLLAWVRLLSKYEYRLIHVMKNNNTNQISSNNAFFIKSKFDKEEIYKDQNKTIKRLFPQPFIETFKKKGNMELFKNNNVEEVKKILKEKWFEEV